MCLGREYYSERDSDLILCTRKASVTVDILLTTKDLDEKVEGVGVEIGTRTSLNLTAPVLLIRGKALSNIS